ncbi:MAG: hypothetical protein VX589_13495 [Myxococcota bacterium]|nr:hypothetical protein [Myxococcota bacterium]
MKYNRRLIPVVLWLWAPIAAFATPSENPRTPEKTPAPKTASDEQKVVQTGEPKPADAPAGPSAPNEPSPSPKTPASAPANTTPVAQPQNAVASKSRARATEHTQTPAALARTTSKGLTLSGRFLTLAHWRNDNDFDETARYDDLDGQSEGQIATFLSPTVQFQPGGGVEVRYRAELGWNTWSRNTPGQPNQYWQAAQAGLVVRHAEVWGQWSSGPYAVRTGFQNVADPSGLFLDQNIGAFQVSRDDGVSVTQLLVAQLPDTTLEGIDVRETNFSRDSFVLGVTYAVAMGPRGLRLQFADYLVLDERSIDRALLLNTYVLGGRFERAGYRAWGHFVGQNGRWENSGVGGSDQDVFSWAAQVGAEKNRGSWRWRTNALALSADDEFDGNDHVGAFFGSARNESATRLMTEDEFRDRYDNFDERVSTFWGPFVVNRAGLAMADFSLGYVVSPRYMPRLVVGGGVVLNPDNALGARFFGLEIGHIHRIELSERARFELAMLTFLPGQASAAFINDNDRQATKVMWAGTLGFAADF